VVAFHITDVADPMVVNHGLGELTHLRFVLRATSANHYSFDHHFGGFGMRRHRQLLSPYLILWNQVKVWRPLGVV